MYNNNDNDDNFFISYFPLLKSLEDRWRDASDDDENSDDEL